MLLALQPADDRVGHRREDDLDGDLERPVEGDDLQHRPRLPGPEEGNRIEEGAVDELADRGRADRAGPEMTSLGPDLHLRHDIAVHEVAAPVGDHRRDDDPPRAPEDDFQGRLDHGIEGLLRIRRHVDHEEPHDRRKDHRGEACPDDFARARVAVDFGQHVAEDVGDREEEVPGAERQAKEDARLARPDQIRAEQHRHESRHDEVVVAVVAGVRDEWLFKRLGGDGHLRTRFLSGSSSRCPVPASRVKWISTQEGIENYKDLWAWPRTYQRPRAGSIPSFGHQSPCRRVSLEIRKVRAPFSALRTREDSRYLFCVGITQTAV